MRIKLTKARNEAAIVKSGIGEDGRQALHDVQQTWRCENCGESFGEEETLKLHLAEHKQSSKEQPEVVKLKKNPETDSPSGKSPPFKKRKLKSSIEDVENVQHTPEKLPEADVEESSIDPTDTVRTLDDNTNDDDNNDVDEYSEEVQSDEEFIIVEGNADGVRALQCPKCREVFSEDEQAFEKHVNECKIFRCYHCGKHFGSEFVLERHVKVFHSKPKVKCDYCVKMFVTKDELAAHVSTWHKLMPKKGPKVLKKIVASREGKKLADGSRECEQCGEVVVGDAEWTAHIALHDVAGVIQCDTCYKTFESEKQMQVHKRNTHIVAAPVGKTCEICSKEFHSTGSFNIHMVEKHGARGNFGCEVCGKQFLSKARMLDHMANHSSARPHICPTCGKTYKTKRNLDDHMRIHLDNEGFPCGKCGKMFKTKQYLSVHLLHTHPDTRRFHCDICGKLFKTKNVLDVHIEYHLNELNYQCDICEKRYNTKKSLFSHKQKHLKTT